MNKKNIKELNLVRSVNKNVRSSTRKLNPILKGIVGKKVDLAIRDLDFSNKRICKDIDRYEGRQEERHAVAYVYTTS